VKVKEYIAIASRECLVFGAPGDTYDDRPTVMKRGSTHVDTAFMGLTSSRSGTVLRTLSTRRRPLNPIPGRSAAPAMRYITEGNGT
jgi:hypothetical protein